MGVGLEATGTEKRREREKTKDKIQGGQLTLDAAPSVGPAVAPRLVSARSLAVESVFDAWLAERATFTARGTAPRLDDKRRKAVLARLGDGFTADDLARAARGIWRSQWHRDNRQTDLALALRDAAHVERFAELAPTAPALDADCSAAKGSTIDFHGEDAPRVDLTSDPRFAELLARFSSPTPNPPASARNGGRS